MKNISSQELQERINIKLDEIRLLFENKNEQYATDDALANFAMGGDCFAEMMISTAST